MLKSILTKRMIIIIATTPLSCVRQTCSFGSAAALLVFSFICLPGMAAASTPSVSEPAPDFVLKSSAGHNLRLSEFRGAVVIVNFWSDNCRPCREQLEWLGAINKESRVSILSINIDGDSRAAERAIADQGLEFPVLFDADKAVTRLYDPSKLPMVVMIDPHGSIRYIHNGHKHGDEALYTQQLAELLTK